LVAVGVQAVTLLLFVFALAVLALVWRALR
jgi:hypothetical protein